GGSQRGADFAQLLVVRQAPRGTIDLNAVDAGLNVRAAGQVGRDGNQIYCLTVGPGGGTLIARLDTAGAITPRLTLSAPIGTPLFESDDGSLVQALPAGKYTLTVSARAAAADFNLTTRLIPAALVQFSPGAVPPPSAVADLDGDGRTDTVLADDDAVR